MWARANPRRLTIDLCNLTDVTSHSNPYGIICRLQSTGRDREDAQKMSVVDKTSSEPQQDQNTTSHETLKLSLDVVILCEHLVKPQGNIMNTSVWHSSEGLVIRWQILTSLLSAWSVDAKHPAPCEPYSKLLTVHDDLNIFEVDLPTSQYPALTAVRPFVCFLDSPNLQVVVGQDYKSN